MNKINYENKIKSLLRPLSREFCVRFALYCAKDSRQYADPKDLALIDKALDLVEKWLKDKDSVTQQELIDVADVAYAEHVTNAAAYAVNTAAYAADAAVYATNAADYAAYTAVYAAIYVADNQNKLKQHYEYLLGMINGLTRLEKVIYGVT